MVANEAARQPLETDRKWDVLPKDSARDSRALLRAASSELGDWKIELAGTPIDGARLGRIAASSDPELERAAREELRFAVDLGDLLYFLDDVLREGRAGRRGQDVVVPSGRARSAGILIHPDEIFEGEPRVYGQHGALPIDRPLQPKSYPPATDGELLGPRWTARYPNPDGEAELLKVLVARGKGDYASRLTSLMQQLRAQGADVTLTSTVRPAERGYLMWGAFELSRASGKDSVQSVTRRVERANRDWGLSIPIRWGHPDGWQATVEAARAMADTYEVVYATEAAARRSNHYTGVAADLVAVALPRVLRLKSPAGKEITFDLSAPDQTRDLSLTPSLIEWLEQSFSLRKLRSDYPHWEDTVAE